MHCSQDMGSAVGRAGGRLDTISKEKLGGKFAIGLQLRVIRCFLISILFYSGPLRIILMPSCLYLCIQRKNIYGLFNSLSFLLI